MNKNYKWSVVGMLWFVCFFNYADRQAMYSVFPVLKTEFGFGSLEIGLIGSAFMWVYAFGAPFAGFIADRVKRTYLILGGCLFWSMVTVTTGWCGKLWQFVVVRALEGVGETFYFPASMSLVGDYHGKKTRSRAFSIHQSSVYAGTIVGSWFAAWLAEHHGWRWGFYLFGAAGVVLSLVLYRFLREPVRGSAEASEAAEIDPSKSPGVVINPIGQPLPFGPTLRLIFANPTALLLMSAFLAANFVATIFLTWTPTFLVEKFDFKLTAAGLSGSVFIHLASAFSVPLGGLLADRFVRKLAGGRMLVQAIGLVIGATFVGLVGLTTDKTTLLWSMSLFGICKGLYDSNIFASLYDVIEPRARATAAGIMNTVGWGGGALGPLAVGLAVKYGRHVAENNTAAAQRAAEIANMSEAIAFGALVYGVGAILLLIAVFATAKQDVQLAASASEPPFPSPSPRLRTRFARSR